MCPPPPPGLLSGFPGTSRLSLLPSLCQGTPPSGVQPSPAPFLPPGETPLDHGWPRCVCSEVSPARTSVSFGPSQGYAVSCPG